MGKVYNQPLPVAQQPISATDGRRWCPVDVFRFKCVVVLTLSVVVFVSAIFWSLPIQYRRVGFDAKDSIKRSASVQACFRLNNRVPGFAPYIARLEYDITGEIGVASAKVAVLSMHQEGKSNRTKVVFGFLPDPINSTINRVSLSLLKASLIDLFLQQFNLTVTNSLFGEPSSFEILKFPGGITVIPEQEVLVLVVPQPLFSFTLNSSINEIKATLLELKDQLKAGLLLMPNEVIIIQITNKHGSTIDPPVIVEASVVSDVGNLPTERLKHLAQIIAGPAKNLGLDHSVFGKVKEISLSSILNRSLQATPRMLSPSPAPSPEEVNNDYGPSPPPALSPNFHYSLPPAPNCYASAPSDALQNIHTPIPQNNVPHHSSYPMARSPEVAHGIPHVGSNDISRPPASDPDDNLSPTTAPLVHYRQEDESSRKDLVSSTYALSTSSWAGNLRIGWFGLFGILWLLLI